MNQKTFYKLIIEFNTEPSKSKSYVKDKRLTLNEKKILEGYYLIRNNENLEATKLMKDLEPSPLPFVEGQRMLLLGLSLNNQSYFHEAEIYLIKALKILEKLETPFSLFMCYFNLSLVYRNLLRPTEMKQALDSMQLIKHETVFQKARFLRISFAYYSLIDDEKNALETLKEIKPLISNMPESDSIAQLVTEFIFHCSREDFKNCEEVLKEMKKHRKFHLTENYTYMKKLLNHLTKDERIYLNESTSSSVPLLNLQLRVIQALEETDLEKASKHWKDLTKMMPEVYQENFGFNGKKCLFSLCLNKHLFKTVSVQPLVRDENNSLVEALYQLLRNSSTPLSKSYIYEYLWDETPVDKEDFNKLERLVSRMRSEKSVDAISRKNTYSLKPESKKKEAG